jgi:cytochrome c
MKSIVNLGTALDKLILATALTFALSPAAAQSVNEDAAIAVAKASGCFRCHNVDKAKKAPSYKRIAAKYKGKDGEAVLMKHLSGAQKVKVEDGGDEEHEPPQTKDKAELLNLVRWILSRD